MPVSIDIGVPPYTPNIKKAPYIWNHWANASHHLGPYSRHILSVIY
jgi:hypothetical protein